MSSLFGGGKKAPTPTPPDQVMAASDASIGKAGGASTAQKTGGVINAQGTSLSYVDTGQRDAYGNPIYAQNTEWAQPTQDFNSGLMGLGGQYIARAQNMLDNPTNLAPGNFDQAQQYATATLGHQQEIAHDRLDNQLKNQGLQPGTQAYDEAMRSQTAGFGDAMNNAMNPIQNQLFNQNLQAAQFGTNQLTQLANPGLQAGFQGMNAPVNPQATSVYNPTNAAQIYQNYDQQQQAAYDTYMKNQSDMMSGLVKAGVGIAAAPMTGGTSLLGTGLAGLGSYLKS